VFVWAKPTADPTDRPATRAKAGNAKRLIFDMTEFLGLSVFAPARRPDGERRELTDWIRKSFTARLASWSGPGRASRRAGQARRGELSDESRRPLVGGWRNAGHRRRVPRDYAIA
jgi:hypothetical protein